MKFYHIISIIKIIVWFSILWLVKFFVDYEQDTFFAFLFVFIWIFITARWVWFYLFIFFLYLSNPNLEKTQLIKKSHKSSLLFGFYVLINISLIFQQIWNKNIWIILLAIFILLQMFVSWPDQKKTIKEF